MEEKEPCTFVEFLKVAKGVTQLYIETYGATFSEIDTLDILIAGQLDNAYTNGSIAGYKSALNDYWKSQEIDQLEATKKTDNESKWKEVTPGVWSRPVDPEIMKLMPVIHEKRSILKTIKCKLFHQKYWNGWSDNNGTQWRCDKCLRDWFSKY